MKTDPKWLMILKNHHKHIPIHTNLMSNFPSANLSPSTKQLLNKENSLKNKLQLLVESLTSELKEKILSFMIWKVMVKNFKLCATSTIIKVFKDSLKCTPSLEEVTLLVLLVNQAEPKEDNFLLLLERFSYFLHVFTCYLKFTLVLKTNNLDTEKDI